MLRVNSPTQNVCESIQNRCIFHVVEAFMLLTHIEIAMNDFVKNELGTFQKNCQILPKVNNFLDLALAERRFRVTL